LTGDIFGFFAAAGALAALLGLIAIWAPRRVWIKITALTTTALFLLVGYVSLVDLLSRPKPVDMEWAHANAADAAVLGVHMEEDKAIYLWLGFEGAEEPRAYVLPWDQETAKQLHDAQRAAEAEGTGVRVQLPFETSLDERERRFYAEPQPPQPAKQAPDGGPVIFDQSSASRRPDGA
jgi:hypothetical protein